MRELLEGIVGLYDFFARVICFVFFFTTFPLWVVPYMVWKKKGGKEE